MQYLTGLVEARLALTEIISDKISKMLAQQGNIERLVNLMMPKVNDIYLLGRSIHFPIALEGAENEKLAYVHAEGIAGEEAKHGPLALMDKNAVVFVLNPDDRTYSDMLSSAYQVKARGAKIIGISNVPNDIYDAMIEIQDETHWWKSSSLTTMLILTFHGTLQNQSQSGKKV